MGVSFYTQQPLLQNNPIPVYYRYGIMLEEGLKVAYEDGSDQIWLWWVDIVKLAPTCMCT